MTKLKRIDPAANSFRCGETKYLIHPSLSISRFREFEKLQVSLGWNADYSTLATGIRRAYDGLQTMKAADASVTLYNLLEGISKKIDGREHEMLLLCSLFINREGEDLAEWSETAANEKIADWTHAGYDVADFFGLAWRLVTGFSERLAGDSRATSTDDTPKNEATEYQPAQNASATSMIFG